ncbi:crotonase/enoyl-CoA hydratase family protein [Nitratireductor sp. CAU 1489]|uniref:Crotonase/enoyl-CoA hydratase family protein n=1 Tax=Nitratireductor arenosus TaxID=2682096 RepID=A0A844QD19_9HYPH|nr:crotonase/enoyl-CoA hydratase family protein [Nitratireductor arenosus]MVA95729.1 crotonase/enoyl-CoA hydratase family protein [Nitratireductor arenosus]
MNPPSGAAIRDDDDAVPLRITLDGPIALLAFNRPEKCNAISDALLDRLKSFFSEPPKAVRVVVLHGLGGHFSAGLDLSEQVAREPAEVMRHSRGWHQVMDEIQFGGLPVVSVLNGAVIGGGLEIAASTHVRIAEPSARFQLPEGKRGIFVGGGATVRVGRILGADRLTEMMLTGRSYDAEEGHRLGLAHYLVGDGEGIAKARELAMEIASNAPLVNYLVIQAVSRIDDMGRGDGLFAESLGAALSQTDTDAREGLRAFLEKRDPRFR